LSETVGGIVTRLEKRDAWKWVKQHKKSTGTILAILMLASAYLLEWWLPEHNKLMEGYNNNRIDERIALKTTEPFKKLDQIYGDVEEIKGKLDILAPLIEKQVQGKVADASRLTGERLRAALPEIHRCSED
jgi:hypothetical protein